MGLCVRSSNAEDAQAVDARGGEKRRGGARHDFLSLTVEKRAMIHRIVEFKEEFGLARHTHVRVTEEAELCVLPRRHGEAVPQGRV